MPTLLPLRKPDGRKERTAKPPPGITREDSDDELGTEDHPWEWIYEQDELETPNGNGSTRKRKRAQEPKIIAARMGDFHCALGEAVLLKAEGSNEAWVGIICDFVDDDEGEKAANFMWFSTEKEIRNKEKKRKDFYPNELYVSPSWDINPLAAINGTARVMSLPVFLEQFPSGKVPRRSKDFGKIFICRRGCSTRTATYTEEFVWEDVYHGREDIDSLVELVKRGTKATRKRRVGKDESPERAYAPGVDADDALDHPRTPKKQRAHDAITPTKQRSAGKSMTPSHRKYVPLTLAPY